VEQLVAVSAIAHLIQLAIAPVFLLTGVGSILNVLSQRLSRVVDRARKLEQDFASLDPGHREGAKSELRVLDRRMTLSILALSFCTATALLVCVLIAILFVADLTNFAFGRPIALLFILAMLMLIIGLILFLWEVRLAMRSIRIRRDQFPHLREN
jgi:Protein of unknown function (DUF2721)